MYNQITIGTGGGDGSAGGASTTGEPSGTNPHE